MKDFRFRPKVMETVVLDLDFSLKPKKVVESKNFHDFQLDSDGKANVTKAKSFPLDSLLYFLTNFVSFSTKQKCLENKRNKTRRL